MKNSFVVDAGFHFARKMKEIQQEGINEMIHISNSKKEEDAEEEGEG